MWILDLKELTDWLAGWRLRLTEFDFEVQSRPGREHTAENAISRFPANQTNDSNFDDDLPAYTVADAQYELDEHDKNEQTP